MSYFRRMPHLSRLLPLLLTGASLLSGCDSQRPPRNIPWLRPAPQAAPPADSAPAAPVTAVDQETDIAPPPTPEQLGYHRYVGTVGAEPVVLELRVHLPSDSESSRCEINCYDARTGAMRWLDTDGHFRADQPLALKQLVDWQVKSYWCFAQPVGPVLNGTCALVSGQHQPIRLRESYTNAVRYEVLTETEWFAGGVNPMRTGDQTDSSYFHVGYLHLLGPDTLRPALARLQCPGPARRHRARRRLAKKLVPEPYYVAVQYERSVGVTLNEADVLAYSWYLREGMSGSRTGLFSGQAVVIDLRNGRGLNLPAQLRPGSLAKLQRRLAQQALADTSAYARDLVQPNGHIFLPTHGFTLTPAGWDAHYATNEDIYPYQTFSGHISWAELGPLLRPNSPLQRLVRARGGQRHEAPLR